MTGDELPDVSGPTEDVLAEFARAIGADIHMVWRVCAAARQQEEARHD